jgi:RNA polymerase sigma factor (sigma-70 family)
VDYTDEEKQSLQKCYDYAHKAASRLWMQYGDTVSFRELRQIGYQATHESFYLYDPNISKAALSTYAYTQIRGYMIRHIDSILHIVDSGKGSTFNKVRSNVAKLKERYTRIKENPDLFGQIDEPDFETYFKICTGLSLRWLREYENYAQHPEYLDRLIENPDDSDTEVSLHDTLYLGDVEKPVDEWIEDFQNKDRLDMVIAKFSKDCSPLEFDILHNRILVDDKESQKNIAEDHNVVRQTVAKTETRVTNKIKEMFNEF